MIFRHQFKHFFGHKMSKKRAEIVKIIQAEKHQET
jgi:hypothetical protein